MDPYNFEGYGQSGMDYIERRSRRRTLVGVVVAVLVVGGAVAWALLAG